MFKRITRAVLAHKQVFIAAIAISGLIGYSLPGSSIFANAQLPDFIRNLIPPINIDRQVQIPIGPYGNIAPLEPREVNISPPSLEDRIQIRIGWSFF
jgi:hypothetical protein